MVNISLAYGAKGIQYYPLIVTQGGSTRPDGSFDNDRIGLIGPDCKPTRYWAYAKTANEQIAIVDEILLKCNSEGIIFTGKFAKITDDLPEVFKENKYRQLNSVSAGDEGVAIGCFDYQGKTALYVVNNDMKARQTVTLGFNGEHTYSLLALGANRQENGNTLELNLAAGAAMLVVVD